MEQFGVLTLGSRLKRLSDFLFQEVQQIYQQCDVPISSTYFPILRLLQTEGPMSVMEIADRLGVSHPAVSKQTSKMIKESLLEKTVDKTDLRRSLLQLSDKSFHAMEKAEPILSEMKVVLERALETDTGSFLTLLVEVETRILSAGVAKKVLDRLGNTTIEPFKSQYATAFYELNMAWLRQYFPHQITEYDKSLLQNPEIYILKRGGMVWFAINKEREGSVIGTVAVLPSDEEGGWSLIKLSVADHCQGMGVAQKLFSVAEQYVIEKGAKKLVLETASCLKAARKLYEKNGFVEVLPLKSSRFERADVYMEKVLESGL